MNANRRIAINAHNAKIAAFRHIKLDFGYLESEDYNKLIASNAELQVELEQTHGINSEQKRLVMKTVVRYLSDDRQHIVLTYANEMAFEISIFDEIFHSIDSKVALLPNVLQQFSYITLSTTRGVLIEKLANTPLAKIFLPLIDDSFLAIETVD